VIRTFRDAADDAPQAIFWAAVAAVVYEKLGKPAGERLSKQKESMVKKRKRKRVARLRQLAAEIERVRSASASGAVAYLMPRWIGVVLLYIVSLFALTLSLLTLDSRQPGASASIIAVSFLAALALAVAGVCTARLSGFCRAVYDPRSYRRLVERPLNGLGALPEAVSAETARPETARSEATGTHRRLAPPRAQRGTPALRVEGTVPKPIRLGVCVGCGQCAAYRQKALSGLEPPGHLCFLCGQPVSERRTTRPGMETLGARARRAGSASSP
jgi:hypothetical protein